MEDTNKEELNELTNRIRIMLNCDKEEFYQKYKAYKKAEKEFKDIYEPFKENLLNLYETEPVMPKNIVLGGVQLTYVSSSTRMTIDSKKLKEEEPELVKKYTKPTNVKASIRLEETGDTAYEEKK